MAPNILNAGYKGPDFDGNGKSDLFWRSRLTGDVSLWLVDGTALTTGKFQSPLKSSDGWQEPQYVDVNGDGKTDLFWRNLQTGQNRLWLIDGNEVKEVIDLPNQGFSNIYRVGDFDGNGKSDFLWYDTATGRSTIWLMDGGKIQESSEVKLPTTGEVVAIDPNWRPETADFNGDKKSDLFWRNEQSGEKMVWIFNGTALTQYAMLDLPNSGGTIELFDYNGDGKTDLFNRQRLTGQNSVWLWSDDPLKPLEQKVILPATGGDSRYVFGDFNGDGKTDIVWQTTESTDLWLTGAEGQPVVSSISKFSRSWVASTGDFNGDGKSDLFWKNVTTGETAIWLRDGEKSLAAEYLNWVDPNVLSVGRTL
jgi:FG-GAP-like repeat